MWRFFKAFPGFFIPIVQPKPEQHGLEAQPLSQTPNDPGRPRKNRSGNMVKPKLSVPPTSES